MSGQCLSDDANIFKTTAMKDHCYTPILLYISYHYESFHSNVPQYTFSLVLVFDYTVVNEIARSCSTPLLTKHGVWQRVLLLQTTRLDATPGTLETAVGCIAAALFCLRMFLLTQDGYCL